jgi:pimeloyl-ACP methyl ester carboxylesterase
MKKIRIILYSLGTTLVLAAIVLYLVFLFSNPERKTITEEVRKSAGGNFVKLSDGFTHYQEGGPDNGATVLLVHGYSVPYYIWDPTYDSLVKNGFHVVRYDEYGRGFSDRPDVEYNPTLYRRQVFDLISALHLKTPLALAGVSFGGAVVSDFAAHYPDLVGKVILVDPVYRFPRLAVPRLVANYMLAVQHQRQAESQLDDFKKPELFPGWADRYKVQMEYKGFRRALLSTREDYPGDSILANYHSMGAQGKKVLLVWGKEDHTVPFVNSDSLREILHPEFFPVDDVGHLPYLEKPGLVNLRIIDFLRK